MAITPGGANTIPGAEVRVFTNAGAPSNGTSGTYAGIATKGSLLIDTTNATAYQNTNTQASPTWGTFPVASAELTAFLAAVPVGAIAQVAATNGANAGGANPTAAEYNVVVAEANETKAKLNTLLTELNTAGILS
jgi:hypothetical protein